MQIVPSLKRSRRGYVPLVRVGLIDSVARSISVPLASALRRCSGHVIVLSGLQAAHTSALLTRQIDLFVGSDDVLDHEGLERTPVLSEPYVLLMPRDSAQPEFESLARRLPFMRFSARSQIGADIERYLRRMGLEPPRGIEFDGAYGVTAMVAAGLGWSISTPLCILESGVPASSLQVFPLPRPGLERRVTVVARKRELGSLPRDLAKVCSAALRHLCQQRLQAEIPWVVDAMVFGGQQGATATHR